jgi:prepilin-type N-terminal cleavage/methylation domain-containing protein/prepilin-type processing-associated H-X9-DG protein
MCGRRENIVNCQRGFTLVELLVVIAIIALLMSILMPALANARKQAQGVMCLSRLHSWGVGFQMFTDDRDGYFMKNNGTKDEDFLRCMEPYIGSQSGGATEAGEMFFCPSAKKNLNVGNGWFIGTTFSAWGPFPVTEGTWWDTGAEGSYGKNDWCSNPPGDNYWGFVTKYAWRTPNVSGRDNVPVLLDCLYSDGFPMDYDAPPPAPDVSDTWAENPMQLFCIDRHNGGVNGLFMDWSARKIGLKELWRLKWHNQFDTTADPPAWTAWMRRYKDY